MQPVIKMDRFKVTTNRIPSVIKQGSIDLSCYTPRETLASLVSLCMYAIQQELTDMPLLSSVAKYKLGR